jgi:hypothetical protein
MLQETDMDGLPLEANDVQAMVRSISKNGDFFLAAAELASASQVLIPSQAVRLYEHIRDNAGRLEIEWRDEFIAAFPSIEPLLPEPLW